VVEVLDNDSAPAKAVEGGVVLMERGMSSIGPMC
jgi:hypothetical protein